MVEAEVFSRATSTLSVKKDVNVSYTELDDFDGTAQDPAHNKPLTPTQAWPTQPKSLAPAHKERILFTALDLALIALPVCLIIKTVLCIYAYRQDKDYTGVNIDEASALSRGLVKANDQLVTLFTIVFVTIMSTFVKRYALWKAQQGASIAELEQLQGSVSLPSTLKLIWSLRSFSVNSLILALTWSFYYLGSQAVKLEYRLSLSADYRPVTAVVQRPDAPSYFTPNLADVLSNDSWYLTYYNSMPMPMQSYLDRLNTNFGATILDDEDSREYVHGSQPNFGTRNGPIIPSYGVAESLNEQNSLTDKYWHRLGGWIDVSKQSQEQSAYISLTGQSIWVDSIYYFNGTLKHDPTALPFLGSYTLYNMSYFNVNCSQPAVFPVSSFPNGTLPGASVSFNMSNIDPDSSRDRHGYQLRQVEYWYKGFAIDLLPGYNATDTVDADFNGTFNYSLRAFQTTCDLTTNYIDMKVRCITTGCYPDRLRWANDTTELEATSYSTPFDNDDFATGFLSNFVLSTGRQVNMNFTTIVDDWFFPDGRINDTYWSTLGPAQFARITMADQTDTSSSLTTGFNTYHMLSQSVLSDYMLPDIGSILADPGHEDAFFMRVPADGAQLNQGYRIYWQWIPVDLVACSILLAAAVGAYWLRVHTLAPDIFGYVSSLTRDNPHIHLPTEGSALSGIDRARMMKDVRVKIADVQTTSDGEGSIGRVGLVPLNAEVRPLHSSITYV